MADKTRWPSVPCTAEEIAEFDEIRINVFADQMERVQHGYVRTAESLQNEYNRVFSQALERIEWGLPLTRWQRLRRRVRRMSHKITHWMKGGAE